ncbi:MAG: DUF1622 domain-containing protein [Chloroflexota bacterium]
MEGIKITSLVIEYLAVAIIVGMVAYSTARYFSSLIGRRFAPDMSYREYKHALGRALLLGLEILVAADVIRTVALEPTFENIAALGLLVAVRTFLGWSLVVEIEGHWPWQPSHTGAKTGGHAE